MAYVPNFNHARIFTDEQESDMVKYIIECSKMNYGLTRSDVQTLAYEMAKENPQTVAMPKTWLQNEKAGIDWLKAFQRRNTTIVVRTPEACSLSRSTAFNRHNVGTFFDKLEAIYLRNPLFMVAGKCGI